MNIEDNNGDRRHREINDAQLIFGAVWEELVEEYGREKLTFPKELILLGGAPGAGKGTQTDFIMKARGLTCPPIVISDLLKTPEMQRIKDQGQMVGDKEVISILLRVLLEDQYRDGALLDGFPRTRVQVECLKLLVNEINRLHLEFEETPLAINFRRPVIHAMVLFVSRHTSIERQIRRGIEVALHNKDVEETGVGELLPERSTDMSDEAAANRYRVFKEQTWDALQSLQEIYHYHFVDAEGPIREVQENILKELQYQSSMELDPKTYDRIRGLPLPEEITIHARQELVKRLDNYELNHTDQFASVIQLIEDKFMPIIVRHAMSGRASVNSEAEILNNPQALHMLIDVFTERGFKTMVDKRVHETPESFDLKTGEIKTRSKNVYRIQVSFKGSPIRRG
ncbi:MAG: nucleoside monophosphate kinase [Planctomycetota bacterium]